MGNLQRQLIEQNKESAFIKKQIISGRFDQYEKANQF